jgi:hypothetical protein
LYGTPDVVLAIALLTALLLAPSAGSVGPARLAQSPRPKPPRHHSKSGEITAYDETAHSLTLKTAKGNAVFSVADARVYILSKSVGLEELSSQVGASASVTYTQDGSNRVAQYIRITPAKPKKS